MLNKSINLFKNKTLTQCLFYSVLAYNISLGNCVKLSQSCLYQSRFIDFFSHHCLRLPGGVDAENLQSFLSADGILTVEAPLPSIPIPADVIIPIQVLIGSDSRLIFKYAVRTYSLTEAQN